MGIEKVCTVTHLHSTLVIFRIVASISIFIWFIASIAGVLTVAGNFAYYQTYHNFGNFYAPFAFAPLALLGLFFAIKLFFITGKMLGALEVNDAFELKKLNSLFWIIASFLGTWIVGGILLSWSYGRVKKIDP